MAEEINQDQVENEATAQAELVFQRATKLAQERRGNLPESKRTVLGRITAGKRVSLALAAAMFLVAVGCGNTEDSGVAVHPYDSSVSAEATPPPSLEQKYLKELPKDIVPEKELWDKYHTRIWNTPDVKLHIRKAALEKEPIFNYLKESGGQLDIILLDGYKVHPGFLSEEQRRNLPHFTKQLESLERSPEEIREFYTNPIYKDSMMRLYKSELDKWEVKLKDGTASEDRFNIEKQILDEKLRPFIEGPNKDDLIAIGKWPAAGRFFPPTIESTSVYDEQGNFKDIKIKYRTYIAFAIKEPPVKTFRSGNERSTVSYLGPRPLDINRGFPNPHFFSVKPDASEYPVESDFQGWTLRHEFAHFEANHPMTDWKALDRLKEAYAAHQKGDDSLYYFVFETPKGNIITKKLASTDNTAA